jgi:hypothetical protein
MDFQRAEIECIQHGDKLRAIAADEGDVLDACRSESVIICEAVCVSLSNLVLALGVTCCGSVHDGSSRALTGATDLCTA